MGADAAFLEQAERFRPALLAHCYRMLASAADAEDAVQETYLRAWRALDSFEGRSSLRTWLYRIATNVCLRTIERRTTASARVLPSGLGAPDRSTTTTLERAPAGTWWVEPLAHGASDPATVVEAAADVRLALVAALQQLPPKQRAALLLCDVLAFSAAETAEALDLTLASVTSALQRARARVRAPVERPPLGRAEAQLVERYADAFARADVGSLVALLRDDVTLEMPPELTWFAGRDDVVRFLEAEALRPADEVLAAVTSANGQPAVALWWLGDDGTFHAHAVEVLTVDPSGIAEIVVFREPALFEALGLPTVRLS